MIPETLIRKTPDSKLVYFSIIISFLINLFPTQKDFPFPDLLAVVLVFWFAYSPGKISIFVAWFLGLLTDVNSGSLLGEHALIYTLMVYIAMGLHRKISWVPVSTQLLQIIPIFLLALIVNSLIRYFLVDDIAPWWFVFKPILEGFSSLIVSWILLKLIDRRTGSSIETRNTKRGIRI